MAANQKPGVQRVESPGGKKPRGARNLVIATLRAERSTRTPEFVRRVFGSDAEMAEVFGVNRSQIARWRKGMPPSREKAEQLLHLDMVIALLEGFLEPESIPKWLNGFNAHLDDRRPIDVVRTGRLSEVVRAIEAEKSGAFA